MKLTFKKKPIIWGIAAAIAIILIIGVIIALHPKNRGTKVAHPVKSETAPVVELTWIDSLKTDGEPYHLCEQILTSNDAIFSLADTTDPEDYYRETTPAEYAFYRKGEGVKDDNLVKQLRLRHNLATVMNQMVHYYEIYQREITAVDDTTFTKEDTLAVIAACQPSISKTFLSNSISDSRALHEAIKLLDTYRKYDGDDSENSPLMKEDKAFNDVFNTFPEFASEKLLDEFEENFWTWYEKKGYVPQIDEIVKGRLEDSKVNLNDEQLEIFRNAIECEHDIDRRAILALEYDKYDDAIDYLGEIIESGQYTKYLFEVWFTWRASVQWTLSPSSFAVIPNNYFERMKVVCMNTIVKHMQTDPDKYDACMLENFLLCPILHRSGSLAGNESLAMLASLKYKMFVQPRLLEEEE